MSSLTVQFPSKAKIISYLERHPLTSKENAKYLSKNKIIEAVATCFANQRKLPHAIEPDVILTMYEVNKRLGLPEMTVMFINMHLTAALKDCADGKRIELEKVDGKTQ